MDRQRAEKLADRIGDAMAFERGLYAGEAVARVYKCVRGRFLFRTRHHGVIVQPEPMDYEDVWRKEAAA